MTGSSGGKIRRFLGDDWEDEDGEEETIGPGKKRIAPEGKYRVLGSDPWPFPPEDWIVGDYDTDEEALEVARTKNLEAADGEILEPGHEKRGKILRYYAYDDTGAYIGGDIHAGE